MFPEQPERRRHRRFSVDRKSLGGLPGGKVFTFRLCNVSLGGAYLRFCDGESDLLQCASCGIHVDEVVELAFTLMVGRQLEADLTPAGYPAGSARCMPCASRLKRRSPQCRRPTTRRNRP